jgi:hypothetical protein
MTPVFSVSNSEYDWTTMLALFSPETKKFYWISGSGCSCCDELTRSAKSIEGMTEGSERELKQALRSFTAHNSGVVTDDEMQKIFSKIKKQK